ncbi:LOW QUALITY PROTEIN: leucine-rich repeat-containing protein 14-like [Haliotis rubra]|uniref:LOW QUALITY PROTEIN: leucine-rich repeat-containing protein 14-like n=1 Tax=Haliotis rubra TaxID=36100 RepID=UPI001EE61C07|nr:LOW QUALITY PROTEIN: leucine-rich repeat-containing protein 14-like [Haliotis rubra]
MYRALDHIDYDHLQINDKTSKGDNPTNQPRSLLQISCKVLNEYPPLAELTITSVPVHLAPVLLKAAVDNVQPQAVGSLIASWPLPCLCFREILCHKTYADIFQEEMGFDLVVFRGVLGRTKACKMKCLDFRGFKLNTTFSKLIIQMWPVLSLKKSQLNLKRLAKVISKTAGVEATRLTEEVLPKLLNEILGHKMIKYSNVLIFSVGWKTGIICFKIHGKRCMLCCRSELMVGDEIMDSLAPFIVLRGQDVETLEGISLRQLEENVFFIIAPDLKKFANLSSLDLQDCNIYLHEGKTRSCTTGRQQIVNTLHCFEHLVRLDIGFNYIVGCLGEVLDALQRPLEYLSIRGCDINEEDLDSLAKSKHAPHLRELNVSKLCQFMIFDTRRIAPSYLLKILKQFPQLTILNLSQNHLSDSSVPEFCHTLTRTLRKLKMLDISANVLTSENQLDITRACANIRSMQKLKLTCVSGLVEEAEQPLNMDNNCEMKQKLVKLLDAMGRGDVVIEVVKLSQAIFVDFVDFMDILR